MGVKYAVNEHFFDTWSPDMAYVFGFLLSDGSMEDASNIRGKYVRVSSTDIDRIKLIRNLLRSRHKIITFRKSLRHKTQYLLRIGSHVLYQQLFKLGMTPHKSLTMPFPLVPRKYFSFFVLGYFDGDGCVFLEKAQTNRPKRLKTIFTSGSKKFLAELQKNFTKIAGTTGGGLYAHASSYGTFQLRYSARDSIRLFLLMYQSKKSVSLALKRKYVIFMTYFKKLELEQQDLLSILKKKGPVAK